MGLFKVIVALGLASAAITAIAPRPALAQQQTDNMGTDFWLAFPTGPSGLRVEISGPVATSGTISASGLSIPFTIAAGSATSVVIPPAFLMTTFDGVQDKAVRVQTDDPVSVLGSQSAFASADSYLALPVDALGKDYRVLSYPGGIAGGQSLLTVTATEADTEVTITPSATVQGPTPGVPYTVTLGLGQVYQLRSPTADGDVTGTQVRANKPVAVHSGNTCADVPIGYLACDFLVEQMPPTSALGRNFVSRPMNRNAIGDMMRIVSTRDGTTVSINGNLVATLPAGAVHETGVGGPIAIQTSAPALIGQFGRGGGTSGFGDPLMMVLQATEQMRSSYDFSLIQGNNVLAAAARTITVMAPTAAIPTLTLDGAPFTVQMFTSWQPVPGTAYSVGFKMLDDGVHRLSGKAAFAVQTYWHYPGAISFGHPAGLSYPAAWRVDGLTLTPPTHQGIPGGQHCVTAQATGADIAIANVPVEFRVSGNHVASATIPTDALGQATFCYPTSVDGDDQIVATVGAELAEATATWLTPNKAPVALCAPQTVAAGAKCSACASIDAGSYDPDSFVWFNVQSPACNYPLGQTLVSLTITDLDGASNKCQSIVTVKDVSAPLVSGCSAVPKLLKLSETCKAEAAFSANATDNCAPWQQQTTQFSFSAPGTQAHTFTFSDGSGNIGSCTQTVTALDITPPTLTCASTAVLTLSPTTCQATYDGSAKVTDACAGDWTVSESLAFSAPGQGSITHTATDPSGNTASCTTQVQAVDASPPTFVPGPIQVLGPANHQFQTIQLKDCGTAYDACDGPIDLDSAAAELVSISSDEPETGSGDSTLQDMRIVGRRSAQLRAERSNKGDGRVYTLHFVIRDQQNNSANAQCQVAVPRKAKEPAVDSGLVWSVP